MEWDNNSSIVELNTLVCFLIFLYLNFNWITIGFFENGNPNGEGMYIPGKLEGDYKEPQIYYRGTIIIINENKKKKNNKNKKGNFKNGYLDGRGKLLNKFTK